MRCKGMPRTPDRIAQPAPPSHVGMAELVIPIRDGGVPPDLVQIAPRQNALKDHDPDVREKAAMRLAFMPGADVIPALLTALMDSSAQVREKAAVGLALRRDGRIMIPLRNAMNDPDSQVREKVAIALGAPGDARAAAPLNAALNDPDPQVREKAAAGILLLSFTPR